MNYENWKHNQTITHGMVVKPIKYKIGQYRAIEKWSRKFVHLLDGTSILDVGCGTGEGMLFFHCFWAEVVHGIDINAQKVTVAQQLGLDAQVLDIQQLHSSLLVPTYDFIWCSHAFEHMYDPDTALKNMIKMLKDSGIIFFILPFPDTGDPKAHCASFEIGTRNDDGGKSVIEWFERRGLHKISSTLDDFREPEIWLEFKKS
jgi:2-polyprenyl-3-methyl-5-hydroxy-6-metoxy-1,4-benzoquinol methylase